ncbi:MAG: cation:proton antiporter [Acidimicrobiia bacterium]|nr:MAG: cation:proton antiporter [Acidimicrobiia bacterium]
MALTDHQVLVFLVQLALLVGIARILGGLARALGQPSVVGELLAGVVLGPSIFAQVWPAGFRWVFSSEPAASSATFGLAWLGVVFLLVVMGFETDLAIISRFRAAAVAVAGGSLLLAMLTTGILGFVIAPELAGGDDPRWVVAAFFALGLSVSALPVVGKILHDLGLIRRNVGQITIAAAMTKDAVGWLLLAALTGVALGGVDASRIAVSFGGLALFALAMMTLGRRLLDLASKLVLARGGGSTAGLSIVAVAALAGGAITQALHVEAILGAYLVGLALSLGRYQVPHTRHLLETMTAAFFAPVFFAYSGLRVDVTILSSGRVAAIAAIAIALALMANIGGSMIGGRIAGLDSKVARALGAGLTPLGVMGVVVAIIGLNAGVLSEEAYTILVLAAVLTSLLAPLLLRLTVHSMPPAPEESARLERESLLDEAEILAASRILLPTRGGANIRYASRLVAQVFPEAEITVLTIEVPTERRLFRWRRSVGSADDPAAVVESLGDVGVRSLRRVARDPAEAIAAESRLGYDLVVMGASEGREAGAVIGSTVVDRVMARARIPVVIVHTSAGRDDDTELPRNILVPVTASRSTRAAEEFAYSVALAAGAAVTAIHVINRPDGVGEYGSLGAASESAEAGVELARTAQEFGARLGVEVGSVTRRAFNAEQEIMEYARFAGVDLLVLGAAARPLSRLPFFGHRIGYMIEHADFPVVVIALPGA